MSMDGPMSLLILLTLYGWPLFIGLGCYIGSSSAKVKAGLLGVLKGYICLLVAISLSWLATMFIEGFVTPHAHSTDCLNRLGSCNMGLLSLGEWIEEWNFVLLEVSAVSVAILLGIKQVKHLTRTAI